MSSIGLIMAGGRGTRLFPTTKFVNKHLLQIYDKPLIYYPISTLMLLGLKKIFLVTNSDDISKFNFLAKLLNNLNIDINIISQNSPKGILDGLFLLKKKKISNDVYFILGDNIFYGNQVSKLFSKNQDKSKIYSFDVSETNLFGIYEKNSNRIIEKPTFTKSNKAITGLYFYKKNVLKLIDKITPSSRNELEITDFNNLLLEKNLLKVVNLPRSYYWNDAGSCEGFLESSNFINDLSKRSKYKFAYLEEVALRKKYISIKTFDNLIKDMPSSTYKENLLKSVENY